MPSNKEDLKAKLMAEAEAAITALLKDERVSDKMTLSEMEAVVGKLGEKLLQATMQRLVEEAKESEGVKHCKRCGRQLRYKGKKPRRVVTLRGEVQLERNYYVCSTCDTGVFPPGSAVAGESDSL
jgi:DNA-directed RNA polymerase subunit RPC12/RpoP